MFYKYSEYTEITNLQAEVERLEGQVCDSCLEYEDDGTPQTGYGWNENAVEGQVPCVCITESGPYQVLEAEVKELREIINRQTKAHHTYCETLEERLRKHLEEGGED